MKKLLFAMLIIMSLTNVVAQTTATHDVVMNITGFVNLAVAPNTSAVILNITSSVIPGDLPQGDVDASKYLQYTCVNTNGGTGKIVAQLSVGTILSGCSLSLTASGVAGNRGTPVSITLSNIAQTLIGSMSSCATGFGATDGANLSFALDVNNPELLDTTENGNAVTVLYTITG